MPADKVLHRGEDYVKAGADESVHLAADYVKEHLCKFIIQEREIIEGPIKAQD